MKRIILLITVATSILFSCHLREELKKKIQASKQTESPELIESRKLLGAFTGDLGKMKINFLISKTSADSIEGRSVVAGKDHLIEGSLKKANGIYTISANELGNDSTSGVFVFTINEKKPDTVKGTWTPNHVSSKNLPINFSLLRRPFVYKKDAGIYTASSSKELSDGDVNSLSEWELQVMKSEILARHGYCFKKKNLRDAFEVKDWYTPAFINVSDKLTEIEKKNIEVIEANQKNPSDE